jgi:hypothetical protein
MIVTHQILTQEDARIEPTAHLRGDLVGIIHQILKLLRESNHGLSQRGQQPLNQIQILVVLLAIDSDSLPLEVVKGHLEINLFEFIHESLSFLELVQLHL